MEEIIISSMATAIITKTLIKGEMFKPLKQYKVFQCNYCLSHWVAMFSALVLFEWNASIIIYWAAIVCGGNLIWKLFDLLELKGSIVELRNLTEKLREGATHEVHNLSGKETSGR